MYVCMYVRMYVCMYICMYLSWFVDVYLFVYMYVLYSCMVALECAGCHPRLPVHIVGSPQLQHDGVCSGDDAVRGHVFCDMYAHRWMRLSRKQNSQPCELLSFVDMNI